MLNLFSTQVSESELQRMNTYGQYTLPQILSRLYTASFKTPLKGEVERVFLPSYLIKQLYMGKKNTLRHVRIKSGNYFQNIVFCCEIFDKKNLQCPDLADIKDSCLKMTAHFSFFFSCNMQLVIFHSEKKYCFTDALVSWHCF